MSYAVKEMFLTLQGEGVQAGRRAVFLRFAGCNLWTGREADRARAICQFCDTDFVGTDGENGGRFADAITLAQAVADLWDGDQDRRFVVVTGGEPMLQLDIALVEALHAAGFEIAVESNGTLAATPGIDWLCISPKAGSDVVQRAGNELKLVWPQDGLDPAELITRDFGHFLVQPMDCGSEEANAATRDAAIALVMQDPRWRLSLQTHKLLGLK
jgi:7-carboxy-7-deazaguanine synthase (Cx14CxxC type)